MTQIVLIHGGESTSKKLAALLPGSRSVAVLIPGKLSGGYDESTGIAHDYPTLRGFLAKYAPQWQPGEPLVLLGYSAGAWALRYYLRDPGARGDITAAIFLDGLYGAPGGVCNMAPYQGVLAYAKEANANPGAKRLIMTYSQSFPGPDACSEAIGKAAGSGGGVFVRGYQNADHGAQQGIVGPEVFGELVVPWIGKGGGSGGGGGGGGGSGSSTLWFLAGVALVGSFWWLGRSRLLENASASRVLVMAPGELLRARPSPDTPNATILEVVTPKSRKIWRVVLNDYVDKHAREWAAARGVTS